MVLPAIHRTGLLRGAAAAWAGWLAGCATPGPGAEFLAVAGARFDPSAGLVEQRWAGPTYHTRLPRGTAVHGTVPSLDYALVLLGSGRTTDRARAARILDRVLGLQVTDASDPYYGLWPWFLEEPVAAMAPPDRNWADFCGARLAQVLVDHAAELAPAQRRAVRRALGHAARAIRERDVRPGYTNIAIMGAAVTAAAGERLAEPGLLVFGRQKLAAVRELAERHGEFEEYNSPTYTLVALLECERVLHLVSDPPTRDHAEALRRLAWRTIATSFHPATQQWAGPHSRSYADRLSRAQVAELNARLSCRLQVHPTERDRAGRPWSTTPALPCPPEFTARFRAASTGSVQRIFRSGDQPDQRRIGTTWIDGPASLGSINRACLWEQRRPLLGYWRTAADRAVVLRLRALKDGRDFAAIGVSNRQSANRVQSTFYLLPERGDHHRHLDAPADGTHTASDLRLRYQLGGRGVSARRLGADRFELRAGDHRAILTPTTGSFAGAPIRCALGTEADLVYLDLVLYQGPPRAFDLRALADPTGGVDLRITAASGVAAGPPRPRLGVDLVTQPPTVDRPVPHRDAPAGAQPEQLR